MNALKLLFLIFGLNVSFLYWGILQERITTSVFDVSYGDSAFAYKFKNIFFLNGTQSVICAFAALTVLLLNYLLGLVTRRKGTALLKDVYNISPKGAYPSAGTLFSLGLSYAMGPTIGLLSLRFISYPLFLLIKTAKLIPNMVIGFLYYGHRYEKKRIFAALVITTGLVLFTVCENQKKGFAIDAAGFSVDSAIETVHKIFSEVSSDPAGSLSRAATYLHATLIADEANFRTLVGVLLVVANMVLDAFTASTQDELVLKYSFSSLQIMLLTNIFAFFVLATACVASEVAYACPNFGVHTVIAFATASASATIAAISSLIAECQGQTIAQCFLIARDFALARGQDAVAALIAYARPSRILPIMQSAAVHQMWVPPQFFSSLVLLAGSPAFQQTVGAYMACGVSGQLFLFTIQNTAGSLFVVSVTMIRKMLSILIALVIAHVQSGSEDAALVDPTKLGAVCLILFGIGLEFVSTIRRKRVKKA